MFAVKIQKYFSRRRNTMKKILSTILSTVIGVTSLASVPCSAADTKAAGDKAGMVILGDSIAAGYTRKGDVAHNYGEICGDYLGCDVSNYAKVGDTTDDMLELIDSFTAEQKKNVADAEYIVISIGGNDIMEYVAKRMLAFAAGKTTQHFFNDGYTKDDIPERPTISQMQKMLNLNGEGGIMEYVEKGGIRAQIELNGLLAGIGGDLSYNSEGNEGYVEKHIAANIKTAADKLKSVNPDAKIMVQTIYQPFQFEPSFISSKYGSKSTKASLISIIRLQLEEVMNSYSENISAIDGIDVVDVKTEFTSYDGDLSTTNPGNTNYFVDVQTDSLSSADVHPNQKGHLAIASAILTKIGKLHYDTGLLSSVYDCMWQ